MRVPPPHREQAIGRSIRHKNDWGAILLLDARFDSGESIGELSRWARGHVRMRTPLAETAAALRRFFGDLALNPPRDPPPRTPATPAPGGGLTPGPVAGAAAALPSSAHPPEAATPSRGGDGDPALTAVMPASSVGVAPGSAAAPPPVNALAAWVVNRLGVTSRSSLVGPPPKSRGDAEARGHHPTSSAPPGAAQRALTAGHAASAANALGDSGSEAGDAEAAAGKRGRDGSDAPGAAAAAPARSGRPYPRGGRKPRESSRQRNGSSGAGAARPPAAAVQSKVHEWLHAGRGAAPAAEAASPEAAPPSASAAAAPPLSEAGVQVPVAPALLPPPEVHAHAGGAAGAGVSSQYAAHPH